MFKRLFKKKEEPVAFTIIGDKRADCESKERKEALKTFIDHFEGARLIILGDRWNISSEIKAIARKWSIPSTITETLNSNPYSTTKLFYTTESVYPIEYDSKLARFLKNIVPEENQISAGGEGGIVFAFPETDAVRFKEIVDCVKKHQEVREVEKDYRENNKRTQSQRDSEMEMIFKEKYSVIAREFIALTEPVPTLFASDNVAKKQEMERKLSIYNRLQNI